LVRLICVLPPHPSWSAFWSAMRNGACLGVWDRWTAAIGSGRTAPGRLPACTRIGTANALWYWKLFVMSTSGYSICLLAVLDPKMTSMLCMLPLCICPGREASGHLERFRTQLTAPPARSCTIWLMEFILPLHFSFLRSPTQPQKLRQQLTGSKKL